MVRFSCVIASWLYEYHFCDGRILVKVWWLKQLFKNVRLRRLWFLIKFPCYYVSHWKSPFLWVTCSPCYHASVAWITKETFSKQECQPAEKQNKTFSHWWSLGLKVRDRDQDWDLTPSETETLRIRDQDWDLIFNLSAVRLEPQEPA